MYRETVPCNIHCFVERNPCLILPIFTTIYSSSIKKSPKACRNWCLCEYSLLSISVMHEVCPTCHTKSSIPICLFQWKLHPPSKNQYLIAQSLFNMWHTTTTFPSNHLSLPNEWVHRCHYLTALFVSFGSFVIDVQRLQSHFQFYWCKPFAEEHQICSNEAGWGLDIFCATVTAGWSAMSRTWADRPSDVF